MTRYILVGGYRHKASDGGKAFCEELVKGFNEPVRVLICLFARPRETWNEEFEEEKRFLVQQLPGKQMDFQLADSRALEGQIKRADVVFLSGGDTPPLLKVLEQVQWQGVLSGKTIAGTSAGACVIAKYYYDGDDMALHEGLGFIQVKVIPHFKSDYNAPHIDWDKARAELEMFKEPLPISALAEGEFKVIEQ